jgi:hypothetical protein
MGDDVDHVVAIGAHMLEVVHVACCSSFKGRVNGCVLPRRYSILSIGLWVRCSTHVEMSFFHAEARIPTEDNLQGHGASLRIILSLHLSNQRSFVSVTPSCASVYRISVCRVTCDGAYSPSPALCRSKIKALSWGFVEVGKSGVVAAPAVIDTIE